MELGEQIKFHILKRILENIEEERTGIHVTSLVGNCLRKSYFSIIQQEKMHEDNLSSNMNEDSLVVLWIGKKLHETPITNMKIRIDGKEVLAHEVELNALGVVGSIDEIFAVGDNIIILDKKTTRKIPNKPYEHHKKQVGYYSVLLEEQYGIKATKGAIAYINVGAVSSVWDQRIQVYVWDISEEERKKFREELEKKVTVISYALEHDKIPPATPSWECNVCPYFQKCIKVGYQGENGNEDQEVVYDVFVGRK